MFNWIISNAEELQRKKRRLVCLLFTFLISCLGLCIALFDIVDEEEDGEADCEGEGDGDLLFLLEAVDIAGKRVGEQGVRSRTCHFF
jgi:hypothetical protein